MRSSPLCSHVRLSAHVVLFLKNTVIFLKRICNFRRHLSQTSRISKTFSEFRALASDLRRAAKQLGDSNATPAVKQVKKAAQTVSLLMDGESVEYVGKVSYTYVKSLAKQRRAVLDLVLSEILEHYPADAAEETNPAVQTFTRSIENFLLTDVVMEDDGVAASAGTDIKKKGHKRISSRPMSPMSTPAKGVAPPPILSPSVVPMTRKSRKSIVLRKQEEKSLEAITDGLVLDDKYVAPEKKYSSPDVATGFLDGPMGFIALAAMAVYVLFKASGSSVTVDSDVALLIGFACYCLGVHSPRLATDVALSDTGAGEGLSAGETPRTPRARTVTFGEPSSAARRPTMKEPAGALLRKSMASIKPIIPESMAKQLEGLVEEEGYLDGEPPVLVEEEEIVSPMPVFPQGAELGTVMNCWSEPTFKDFKVRGNNYLTDRIKIPSGPFLFPVRGVDLFITDLCPENIGRNTGIMGGKLRDVPTMIINFRLPWGVLLYYFEIPKKFIPFLNSRYDPSFDKSKLPSMKGFTGAERSAARYLMGDDEHKNETLKIVPVVVKGPWVCKSIVGGKPAIIGTKMPVSYFYQPAEPEKGKAQYLEMDLDIVASSAARGILSVVRGYTNVLTMDLGFVIQGNQGDELPEQMLVGARLHSIDPLTAPNLPPMKDIFNIDAIESDFGSVTSFD